MRPAALAMGTVGTCIQADQSKEQEQLQTDIHSSSPLGQVTHTDTVDL